MIGSEKKVSALVKESDYYLTAFESLKKAERETLPSWVQPLRHAALTKFTALGFPTPREEDWKYTNVGPYVKSPFQFRFEPFTYGLNREKVSELILGEKKGPTLVFVNGLYSDKLSQISNLPKGAKIKNLSSALREDSQIVER